MLVACVSRALLYKATWLLMKDCTSVRGALCVAHVIRASHKGPNLLLMKYCIVVVNSPMCAAPVGNALPEETWLLIKECTLSNSPTSVACPLTLLEVPTGTPMKE